MLGNKLIELLAPIQESYWEWEKRPDDVRDIAADGAKKARELIAPLVKQAKQAIGLYSC